MQLQCRNSKNDTEALQTKDGIQLNLFSGWLKNSAKRVIMAQSECRLAQLIGRARCPYRAASEDGIRSLGR